MTAAPHHDCLRLIEKCDFDEPYLVRDDELHVAEVLAERGYLELLPGCVRSYGATDKGRAAIGRSS